MDFLENALKKNYQTIVVVIKKINNKLLFAESISEDM